MRRQGGFVGIWCSIVLFFEQKTAYEMLRSRVGSEMCIRDRTNTKRKEQKKQF